MNNFMKLALEFSELSPLFLLYILAPNKIKRPILRKKGGLLTVVFFVCYCLKSIMPFYLQNHAIGFNCILLVIYLLDFVILSFTTQSNPMIYQSPRKKGHDNLWTKFCCFQLQCARDQMMLKFYTIRLAQQPCGSGVFCIHNSENRS